MTTIAERRHPRPGTGSGYRVFGRYVSRRYVRPFISLSFGRPYRSYGSYYDPFFYGSYGYSSSYYAGYGPYPYPRYSYESSIRSALRVIVDPPETRVLVDDYYAGIADDFDGLFQRLYVSPGRHEITLELEGYRTQQFAVDLDVDQTVNLHHLMVPGGERGDEPGDARGEDGRRYEEQPRYEDRGRYDDRGRNEERGRYQDSARDGEYGTLRMTVRPPNASVYVDDEFRGTAREAERLQLSAGPHRIEVIAPGHRVVQRDVTLGRGETRDLAVDLPRN